MILSVELGYFINPEYPAGYPLARAVTEQRETVALARDLGMKAVLVGEHFSHGDYAWLPPLMLLSRVCDAGEGMLFGTGVLVAPLHNPVVLAEQAAFLDAMTEGNFVLGVSAGWNPREFEALGVPLRGRGARLEEAVSVMRQLWSSTGPVSFKGAHYEYNELLLGLRPVRPGGPRIWMGGSSPVALERAARMADGWLISSHVTAEAAADQAAVYARARSQESGGEDTVRPALRNVFVARTAEGARATAGPYITASYQMFQRWGLFSNVLGDATADVDFALASQRAVIGNVEQVAEELVKFVRTTGANLLLARSQWLGIPHAAVNKSMELLADEVMPLVRRALDDGSER